jgi:hypothetical protein
MHPPGPTRKLEGSMSTHEDVDKLERHLKWLWDGFSFEEVLDITTTLDHYHRKLKGSDWDGVETIWIVEYLIAEHGLSVADLSDKNVGELAALLRRYFPVVRDSVPKRTFNLSPARREVLELLAKSKTRLTEPKVYAAMCQQHERNVSKDTVRVGLNYLMQAGWIDNDQKPKPPGYGITESGRNMLK